MSASTFAVKMSRMAEEPAHEKKCQQLLDFSAKGRKLGEACTYVPVCIISSKVCTCYITLICQYIYDLLPPRPPLTCLYMPSNAVSLQPSIT
jgi:hypothetical protein